MKLHAKITEEGKLEFTGSRVWVASRIRELPRGQEVTVEIKKYFKKRSKNQNKYYWGVVVSLVYEGLRGAGYGDEILDEEDAHDFIKTTFFKKVLYHELHDNLEIVKSTTKFSTAEFEERLENVRRWAKEFLNIRIPLPNEQLEMEI